ncbi:hypothetical protein T440DRAFT_82821 [Plenodomus tracheiphilus IPT5]|uniref:Uncharacterized protein n=1 Tax=Plenodomus tracheiphilus IPT5 TaxID=1408161 RepID=A0A6A7B7G9_9PLEO|nr:hypothetical protein T440DRAFT_82821 [Plenodomus tracheiphilus IPT5]
MASSPLVHHSCRIHGVAQSDSQTSPTAQSNSSLRRRAPCSEQRAYSTHPSTPSSPVYRPNSRAVSNRCANNRPTVYPLARVPAAVWGLRLDELETTPLLSTSLLVLARPSITRGPSRSCMSSAHLKCILRAPATKLTLVCRGCVSKTAVSVLHSRPCNLATNLPASPVSRDTCEAALSRLQSWLSPQLRLRREAHRALPSLPSCMQHGD